MKRQGKLTRSGKRRSPGGRLLSILLAVCMMITMLPVTVFAVEDPPPPRTFVENITVGVSAVPCTFFVITEPADGNPGTVQIGNGSTAAITNTAGTLAIPISIDNDSKTYNIVKIGNKAFDGCSSLTGTLTIPSGVTSIGKQAFNFCTGFNGYLTIPAGVTYIGDSAFANCNKFTGNLTIPSGVTTIGSFVFFSCGFTGNLTILPGVTSIGDAAFSDCSRLTGGLTIPSGVTSIGRYAFRDCSSFTEGLTIPSGVTSIGEYAFSDCIGFTGNLTLPSTVTSIGNSAFSGCSGLTGNLTIESGVDSIEYSAFSGCPLNSVTLLNSAAPSVRDNSFIGDYIINVPSGATGYNTDTWASFYSGRINYLVNAAAPSITHDLSTTQVEYSQNATAAALDATSKVTDGGVISYAWYRNTTNSTDGATPLNVTTATYTPSTATVGTTYYYCVVTNTNNAAAETKTAQTISAIANIKVNAPANASQLAESLGSNATWSGNTVTLTDNILNIENTIQIEPSENITLNLAGHTISGKNDISITPLKIIGGVGTLTINGSGTILGSSVENFNAATAISIIGGTVVIENGSIIGGVTNHGSGYRDCGHGIDITSGNLTIQGGAIKGGVDPDKYNYAGNGLNLSGGTVTIYGGSFYSGEDLWNNSRAIFASSETETVADIIVTGKIMKSYADEDFSTGEAITANDTLLSALTAKYIKVQDAPIVNAETPAITHDLSTTQVQYSQNAAATALDSTATVTDGGVISYAWYSNTTNSITDATALGVITATYIPPTATVGTTYYFCVVTNTNNDVNGNTTAQTTSAIANIKVNAPSSGGGGGGSGNNTPVPPPPPVITVSEVKSELFENTKDIKVEADVTSAFGQSVEVKITDSTESEKEVFSLAGADDKVYPFDISLYSKGSNNKVQPKDGYSVKITIPVPQKLLEDREQIKVVYGKDGKLETLKSELIEKDGKWYIIFEATHFSPYALVVSAEPDPSVSWTNPFSDVKESDLYYSAVQYVAQNGLMVGTGSNTFSPAMTANRGMIVTILYRLSGSPETSESTFTDVKPDAYYAKAVAWAQRQGIITGYGNGMFGPEDSITREQMLAILWRYAGSPVAADNNGLAGFMDDNEISLYAKDALAWIYEKGIFEGQSNGILDPKGKVTRAEVAIIINYVNIE